MKKKAFKNTLRLLQEEHKNKLRLMEEENNVLVNKYKDILIKNRKLTDKNLSLSVSLNPGLCHLLLPNMEEE